MYIPMSNSPARAPGYLSMDMASPWHIAALQVVGLESMTISSRLRTFTDGRGTFQDLEDSINNTGKRRIAKLGMSIADPDVLSEKASEEVASAEKAGSTSEHLSEGEDQLNNFDIDIFTRDYRVASRRSEKKEHIFGRTESSRGDWFLSDDIDGHDRHDRFHQGPVLQRYVPKLLVCIGFKFLSELLRDTREVTG